MAKDCMLTTFDNPYNPFDDFTLWLLYDKEQGYNTCERLARIAKLSDDICLKMKLMLKPPEQWTKSSFTIS